MALTWTVKRLPKSEDDVHLGWGFGKAIYKNDDVVLRGNEIRRHSPSQSMSRSILRPTIQSLERTSRRSSSPPVSAYALYR